MPCGVADSAAALPSAGTDKSEAHINVPGDAKNNHHPPHPVADVACAEVGRRESDLARRGRGLSCQLPCAMAPRDSLLSTFCTSAASCIQAEIPVVRSEKFRLHRDYRTPYVCLCYMLESEV
ncbi:unnamed protein product [Symbiodinium sp. CCMP2592]|nr:unnamed protein product [Symbiodinium sp. CCMP2592]